MVKALAVTTTMVLAAGCGRGSSESAAATPTPSPARSCQIVWSSPAAADPGKSNIFVMEAPAADWTAGAHTIAGAATFYYQVVVGPDGELTEFLWYAQASGEAAWITATPGAGPVTVALTFEGDQVAGSGSFSGNWGQTSGTGGLTVAFLGSSLTIGNPQATCE